jgi:ATP-dependent Lhr-like helicase
MLPWGVIAGELQRMEMRGEIRRGYFVKGLSGMQFALPEAIEALRQSRTESREGMPLLLLNSCDPANPYGPGIELSATATQTGAVRLTRLAGNYLIFSRGSPVLLIENYGSRLWTLSIQDPDVMYKGLQLFVSMLRLPPSLRPFREITIESVDSVRASESPAASMLRSLGFRRDQNQTMSYDGYA